MPSRGKRQSFVNSHQQSAGQLVDSLGFTHTFGVRLLRCCPLAAPAPVPNQGDDRYGRCERNAKLEPSGREQDFVYQTSVLLICLGQLTGVFGHVVQEADRQHSLGIS